MRKFFCSYLSQELHKTHELELSSHNWLDTHREYLLLVAASHRYMPNMPMWCTDASDAPWKSRKPTPASFVIAIRAVTKPISSSPWPLGRLRSTAAQETISRSWTTLWKNSDSYLKGGMNFHLEARKAYYRLKPTKKIQKKRKRSIRWSYQPDRKYLSMDSL